MIYYARHGESLANKEGYFAGLIDSPLTEKGKSQAKEIGLGILKAGIKVDTLISSPMQRAYNSALIVAENIGISEENIEIDQRIVEYDFGELTGIAKYGVDHDRFYAAVGREKPSEFHSRVNDALIDYSNRNETILVIGHSFVKMMMQCIATKADYTKFNELPSDPNDNGVITEIKL